MPPQDSQVLVALGPDLFVALDGTIIRKTLTSPIIQSDAAPVFGGMPVFTPIKPLGDPKQPHPNEVWDNVKTATELADTVKELAEHGLKTVGSIASIVGAVGVVLELLDSAGLFGRKTTLDDVLKVAWDNFVATVAASQISHLQNMAPHVATVQGALDAVETFAQGTGTRQDLAQFDHDMVGAINALTDAAFQLVVFNYAEYMKFPWLWEDQWLTVPPHVETGVPPQLQVPRYPDMVNGTPRFDYRFAIGNIIFAVTTRVMMMHVLEPEFRSTRRYREQLLTICDRLKDLQTKWLQSIQWPWQPSDDEPAPITISSESPWWSYVPVGAVDICTGISVWTPKYEPVWNPNAPLAEPERWAAPFSKPGNWPNEVRSKYYQRARELSEAARQTVLEQSGYLAFAAFVASICKLTTDPGQSETVSIKRRPAATGMFDVGWREAGTAQKIAGAIACERKTFTATVFTRASASTRLEIRTQTPDSIASFAIPYEFLLVTGAGEKTLQPGPGRRPTTIRAPRFVAEVGPAGERREVDAPWADTTIDYALTVTPGFSSLTLSVESGVNVKVMVRVRETIRSGTVFVTDRDVTLTTEEHRLPSAYFQHLEECERRANKLLGELNTKYAISEAPGPRFNPRLETASKYLDRVQRERPDDVQRALVSLGFR